MTTRVSAAVLTALLTAVPAMRPAAGRTVAPGRAVEAAATAAGQEPTDETATGGRAVETVADTVASAATAAVGDPVTVTVTVRHPAGTEVRWPDPVDAGPFELLGAPVSQSTDVDGGRESRLELRVAAFELGDLSFPSLDLVVVDAAGDAAALASEALAVTIESVGRDEGGDIRDIKGPLAIPFAVAALLPWLAALLALAAAAAWLHRRRRRRSGPESRAPAVPPRPAHEVALEALDALDAEGLIERGEIKTYHIRLSDILRVYLEGRFGLDAPEMTTGEVLDGLRGTDAGGGVVADLRGLLDRCDLVKFAKLRPPAAACRELAPLARRVVNVTTPAEPAAPEPAAVPAEQTT